MTNFILLRAIIQIIENTLDVKELTQKIVDIIGKSYNVDRCIIGLRDIEQDIFTAESHSEYLSDKEIISCIPIYEKFDMYRNVLKEQREFFAPDVMKTLKELGLTNTPDYEFARNEDLKSNYGFAFYYHDIYLGVLALDFIKNKVDFNEEEIEFFRTVTSLISIAVYFLYLYQKIKSTKNTILAES